MKLKPINTLLISALASIGIFCIGCQKNTDGTSVEEAAATEISNHLDLEVVISLFGESENLEDFENKLNQPERQISNLDLNEDGEVDYLRVVESSMDETHLVSVQAVIGEDQYQDVATFDVERDEQGETQVQVVGDPYVYGSNYAIRPTFSRAPLILAWLWGSSYRAWNSPYSWGKYPSHYRSWNPYPYEDYRKRVNRYRNSNYAYHYGPPKRNKNSTTLYKKSNRNDYASKHPGKSFTKRNKGVENRYKFDQKKGKTKDKVADNKRPAPTQKPAAKPPKPPGKPTQPAVRPSKPTPKPSQPAVKPAKPSSKPSKPAAKPSKPASKPAAKPPGKSGAKPAKQPTPKTKGKK